MLKVSWRWWAVAAWVLMLMQQLPRIPRQVDFYESLQYYANEPLEEYPTVATWPLLLFGNYIELGFVILLVLIEGAILAACIKTGKQHVTWLWLVLLAAMGPLMLSRMDLIPAALVAAAVALMMRLPWVSGAILAVAAGMKLWPGALAAAFLGAGRRVAGFITVFVGLVATSVLIHGVGRTISPLMYQQYRGIQVESLFGAPLLLNPEVEVGFAASRSFEVFGPGVETVTRVADISQILLLVGALIIGLVSARRSPEAHLACATIIVLFTIATNKVFSPQYVVWMLPLMLVVANRATHRSAHILAWLSVPIATLTTVIYPIAYIDILNQHTGPVLILLARNALVVVACVLACYWWVRTLKPGTPQPAPADQCPQPS